LALVKDLKHNNICLIYTTYYIILMIKMQHYYAFSVQLYKKGAEKWQDTM